MNLPLAVRRYLLWVVRRTVVFTVTMTVTLTFAILTPPRGIAVSEVAETQSGSLRYSRMGVPREGMFDGTRPARYYIPLAVRRQLFRPHSRGRKFSSRQPFVQMRGSWHACCVVKLFSRTSMLTKLEIKHIVMA